LAGPKQLRTWDPTAHIKDALPIDYHATLVGPAGAETALDGLPLVVFFGGLGGPFTSAVTRDHAARFADVSSEPFVLVEPKMWRKRWWFIDDCSKHGWVRGRVSTPLVKATAAWIKALAALPGLDASRVALMGYSAGAYACTELMACGDLPQLTGVGLGGTHGHGQLDLATLPADAGTGCEDRFPAYLERLAKHSGASHIEMSHARNDRCSLWADALEIMKALNAGQQAAGLPSICFRDVKPEDMDRKRTRRKNENYHLYFNNAFLRPEFFAALLSKKASGRAAQPAPLESRSATSSSSAAQPALVLKAATARIDNILGSDENRDLQNVLEQIWQQYLWDKPSRVLATATSCYDAAASLPDMEKLEAFLEIIEEQRAQHLSRHPEMPANAIFSRHDMQEIYKEWMDGGNWMSCDKASEYHRLCRSRQRGDGQKAHQMRRQAFGAFLFQVIGNEHVLLAAIKYPVFSAAQPDADRSFSSAEQRAAVLQAFMDAWEEEETTESRYEVSRRQRGLQAEPLRERSR